MTEERLTPYRLLANSIRVVDIATPLTHRVLPTADLSEVFNDLTEDPSGQLCIDHAGFSICLVCDEDKTYGYFTVEDFHFVEPDPASGSADEMAKPISPDMAIPALTPLVDFLPLLPKRDFHFVSTGN